MVARFSRKPSDAKYPYLWKGLEVYWDFMLGATGLTAHDISGRGNDGTLINDPVWVPNGGMTFDGTNYIDHGHVSIPNDFTIMARCKLDEPPARARVINFLDASSGRRGMIELAQSGGDGWIWVTYDNNRYSRFQYAGTSLWDGSMATIAGVSNGVANPALYINGVNQSDFFFGAGNPSDDDYDGFRIGASTRVALDRYYTGEVSFGALWSRILTQPEMELISEDSLAIVQLKTKTYLSNESISPTSSGSNVLIKEYGKVIQRPMDAIDRLHLLRPLQYGSHHKSPLNYLINQTNK